ncbi:MAG: nucleoside recognition domain-containing protein [Verrucomicrobiota bacterium]
MLGLESVGKTSLLDALSGRLAEASGFSGSTLHCRVYSEDDRDWIDTPGIVSGSDAATVKEALEALATAENVLLVLRAHRAQEELKHLLPLAGERKIALALTFRDRLAAAGTEAYHQQLDAWRERLGVPVVLLDARRPGPLELAELRTAVDNASSVTRGDLSALPAFPARLRKPSKQRFERALGFAPLSLLLLFGPAWLAVTQANAFADSLYAPVMGALRAPLDWLNGLPQPLPALLSGDYGVVAMFPFLLLYALPTILIFSAILALYKNTGLIDRLSYGLHPWLRPFGLGGRDLVRVVMGFGCNVPAVTATRSCPSCSRGACVSAISFGSACSYQLPATLAVFAAAGYVWLAPVYVGVLAVTTLIYLRLTTPIALRRASGNLLLPPLGNLHMPRWRAIWREVVQSMRDFFQMALPIFIGICFLAGLLQWSGILKLLSWAAQPVMALLRLPPEAASAVVLGSVRKDGLAIGLLEGDFSALKVPLESPVEVLTAVYLAGVLLPCLVTLLAVAREMRPAFALKMAGRQAAFAFAFAVIIAWAGALILGDW